NSVRSPPFVGKEQEGIAKGVRRIVGVTRRLALEAMERSKAFAAQLDVADGIEGLALDTEVWTTSSSLP
ncbi:unnamed protein product, partial [Sphacelaria rigidula]